MISDDKMWRIVPTFSVFHSRPLEPRNEDERKLAAELGPVYRIVYCRVTYDMALMEADRLVKLGIVKDPSRVEYYFAEKEEMEAIRKGHFTIQQLSKEPFNPPHMEPT